MSQVILPTGIDYTRYHSSSGLGTTRWGPAGWSFLFSCIIGAYPVKLDATNKEHLKIRKHFVRMIKSLGYTMPCIFCRNSFKDFYKELPITSYLIGRIELMYWLYLIRDKVNRKLIGQEQECYNDEKKRLKKLYYRKEISETEYYKRAAEFKQETFKTQPTPPFQEVLDKYESIRAVCSKRAKTCALPKKD